MRKQIAFLSIIAALAWSIVAGNSFAADSCSAASCCSQAQLACAADPTCGVTASDATCCEQDLACCSPGCSCSQGCSCAQDCCEPWEIGASWLMMSRVTSGGPVFLNQARTAVVVNANEFNTDYQPGFELTARGRVRGVLTDIRYFQLDGLDDRASRVLPSPVFYTGAPLGFTNPVQFAYQSDLYSAEINFLTDENCNSVRWLAGLRYLQYNEVFRLQTPSNFTSFDETHNHLYGLQVGMDVNLLQTAAWEFRGYAKTGIYYDAQYSHYFETTGGPETNFYDKQEAVAFVGELGLTGRYCLSKNWSLDAGYRVLWLGGIAVAGEQFSTTSIAGPQRGTVINQGDVFLHGFNLGLTYSF